MGFVDFLKYLLGEDEPALVNISASGVAALSQFSIEDGVLLKYNGSDAEVRVPDGVTAIGGGAFADSTVRSVSLPDSVTEIRNGAFKYCARLEKIELSEALQSIGSHAFWKCYSLKYLDIPNSVASIGMSAFEECKSLVRVNIPHSLTEIGMSVFQGCESLVRIAIPDNIEKIDSSAFRDCKCLSEVKIPDSVEIIGSHCFLGCSSLRKVSIPDTIEFLRNGVFLGCTVLETIEIPDSVRIINEMAFSGCVSLDNVVIPDSVYRISDMAFLGCKSLKNVRLPIKTAWKLGDDIFKGCPYESEFIKEQYELDRKKVCADPADIEDWEYERNWSGMEIKRYVGKDVDVSIPEFIDGIPVVRLRTMVFYFNHAVESVYIPETVSSIDGGAFLDCFNLKRVNIPDIITEIPGRAFCYCKSLEKIVLPRRVKKIDYQAFDECRALKSINLPKRVREIAPTAFRECTGLYEVKVEQGNKHFCDIDGVLFSADKTKLLLYPSSKMGTEYRVAEGVQHIPQCAFGKCQYLKRLYIPDSVQIMDMTYLALSSVEEVYFEGEPRLENLCGDVGSFRLISQKCSAKQWAGKKVTIMLARGWVYASDGGMQFPDDIAEENKEFIRLNRRMFYGLLDKDIPMLKYMCKEKLITRKVVQNLFEKAKEDPSLMAVLLEYTKDIFPETDFGDDTYNLE